MPRPEEFPVKVLLGLTKEQEARIADWRRKHPDLPNRNQAIRELLDIGLGCGKEAPAPRRGAPSGGAKP